MLESQLRGEIDSWAIRWNLSVFMEQGLVLFPKKAMVKNIGFDGSGRHCGNSFLSQTGLLCENSDSNSINYPAAVSVDDLSYKRMKHNIRSIGTGGSSWARNLWVR